MWESHLYGSERGGAATGLLGAPRLLDRSEQSERLVEIGKETSPERAIGFCSVALSGLFLFNHFIPRGSLSLTPGYFLPAPPGTHFITEVA